MRWTIGDVFTIFSLIIGTPIALRMLWRGYGPHVHRWLDVAFPPSIMSREEKRNTSIDDVDPRDWATGNDDGQRIAMRGNEVNTPLVDQSALIADAVFAANVDACVRVIATGKIGQTEAIESVFGCKRSGKPDSAYARARAAVGARLGPQETVTPIAGRATVARFQDER